MGKYMYMFLEWTLGRVAVALVQLMGIQIKSKLYLTVLPFQAVPAKIYSTGRELAVGKQPMGKSAFKALMCFWWRPKTELKDSECWTYIHQVT